MSDYELEKAARMILEGKKPEKKDKSDDIEIDVKTKDGKVTKLHTKDSDGDGKSGDGTPDEKDVSKPKKKDGDKDGKINDGSSKESNDDSKDSSSDGKDAKTKKSPSDSGDAKSSGDDVDADDGEQQADSGKKKADSPVKDDSADDGAQEKEVPEDGEESGKSDGELPVDKGDETEGEEGPDGKSKKEKEEEVTGSEKTKVDLKPKLKDETPGEMPVSEETLALRAELERALEIHEKFAGQHIGESARIIDKARAKSIAFLQDRVFESELNDLVRYFDTEDGFPVVDTELGEGRSIPGEFYIFNDYQSLEALVMFKEGVESVVIDISEISKKVLGSYINKASTSRAVARARSYGADLDRNHDRAKKYDKIEDKRADGISKAVSKLTKEEVELDEKVLIKYDDPSGKGTASMQLKVPAKTKEQASARALKKIKQWPHPISGYKNAKVARVTKEEVELDEAKDSYKAYLRRMGVGPQASRKEGEWSKKMKSQEKEHEESKKKPLEERERSEIELKRKKIDHNAKADKFSETNPHKEKRHNQAYSAAAKLLDRKKGLIEGQSSKGHMEHNNAKAKADEHWALASHHEELAADHENNERYDEAAKHDKASEAHRKAADWYDTAARSHRQGDDPARAEYQHSKADGYGRSAHNHTTTLGIQP